MLWRPALRLLSGCGRPSGCLALPYSTSRGGVGVLGAMFEKGQPRAGVSEGPQVIRETGVLDQLTELGLDVRDYGDVREADTLTEAQQVGPDGERNYASVLEYNRRLAAAVTRVHEEGRLCVTLGGDHSVAIGTIAGHTAAAKDKQIVVVWVDAHADINTASSTTTGNMHGMPLAYHLRQLHPHVNKMPDGWPSPCIDAHHLVYIGLRDVDKAESEIMDNLGILWFGVEDVDRLGMPNVLEACLKHLRPSTSRPIHLSFDIDALDPLEAPSTGTAVRGGLNIREGLAVCEAVRATGHLSAVDLVEVNPKLGTGHDATKTAHAARLILLGALAGHRRA